jgi:hypothetical protein
VQSEIQTATLSQKMGKDAVPARNSRSFDSVVCRGGRLRSG